MSDEYTCSPLPQMKIFLKFKKHNGSQIFFFNVSVNFYPCLLKFFVHQEKFFILLLMFLDLFDENYFDKKVGIGMSSPEGDAIPVINSEPG